ncbi:pterin-4-alpha-carbinolamine dehydratase 2, mitochondrial isoform X3 [Solanum lycopersicum]|uniref:pterin-4-alpha-carbinolamine dehydratase 2, mitochondrial isoform X3 n=1 Tax=Solanum lycopersicum TaxID=4081 RepID=UPI003748BB39
MIRTLQARLANLLDTFFSSSPVLYLCIDILFNFFRYRLHHSPKPCTETMEVSAKTNTHYGIKTLSSAAVLSTKKCVPCNTKDLRPMTEEAAYQLMPQVSGWDLVNDGGTLKLHKSWKVKTFTKGLEFFQEVASVAEAEGHHPDLHLVGWNNVKIDIWTHSVGLWFCLLNSSELTCREVDSQKMISY